MLGLCSQRLRIALSKIRHILLIVLVLSLSDIHWAVMQSYTWVEMAINSSAENGGSFLPSLKQSIKGEASCARCCELEKSRNNDSQRTVQWETKLLAIPANPDPYFIPKLRPPENGSFSASMSSRSDSPETPPPLFV